MVIPTPSKAIYDVNEGFWYGGVLATRGGQVALTDAEARYLLLGGNVSLPKPQASPAPVASAPAQA
jgi:hypothetical protein